MSFGPRHINVSDALTEIVASDRKFFEQFRDRSYRFRVAFEEEILAFYDAYGKEPKLTPKGIVWCSLIHRSSTGLVIKYRKCEVGLKNCEREEAAKYL